MFKTSLAPNQMAIDTYLTCCNEVSTRVFLVSHRRFPETPLLHVKITLTCATLLLLLGFSIYSNSAAKGCVSDGYGIGYFISFFGAIPEVALRQPQDHTLLTSYK